MIFLQFIKNNFMAVVVIILVALLFLQRCNTPKVEIPKPIITVQHDTIYYTVHDTLWTLKYIPGKPMAGDTKWKHDTVYIPAKDYDGLLKQYTHIEEQYFGYFPYEVKLSLGKYGSAILYDTISTNNIVGSKFIYDIKVPEINNTTTIKEPYIPKTQFYLGGGIDGSKNSLISSMDIGFLVKNKKDQIFGVKAGMGIDGVPHYGVQSYWKISFKK